MKRILSFFFILFFIAATSSFAHGIHFDSPEKLSKHIQGHITHLETLLESEELNAKEVQRECRELTEHAQQYQILAKSWISKKKNLKTAQSVENAGQMLENSARQQDLRASLTILRDLQMVLQA